MKKIAIVCWTVALGLMAGSLRAAQSTGTLRIHPENPRYFEFQGKPAVLVTAGEHYGAVINKDFDYVAYLDELARHQFNLTRIFSGTYRELPDSFTITGNTLAPAAGRYVGPWARSQTPGAADGGNKFDLTRWDEAYLARLKDFIGHAARRGIVVELVFFCTLYNEPLWAASPMHARNNVNDVGTVARTEVYSGRDRRLTDIQTALVRKLVTELNAFDNLYFEICNEPYERGGLTTEWNSRIIQSIREAEAALPKKHLIAQGFPPNEAARDVNAHVAIMNFHAARPRTIQSNWHHRRVAAFDETGGSDRADRKYRTEGWEWIVGGGAVYDHLDFSFTTDRPDGSAVPLPANTPGGGGPELRRQLRVLKEFISGFNFIRMSPAPGVIQDRRITGATAMTSVTVLAEKGKAYAIYIHGGTQADVTLELPATKFKAEWVNTKTGNIEKSEAFTHTGPARMLSSPTYVEDIALRVVRAD